MAIPYVTHEGKAYQQDIKDRMLGMQAWHKSETTLELKALVCFKDERRQDISNRIKVLEDCLMHGNVIVDDKQVETLEVRRGPNCKVPHVRITLREILSDRSVNLQWILSG